MRDYSATEVAHQLTTSALDVIATDEHDARHALMEVTRATADEPNADAVMYALAIAAATALHLAAQANGRDLAGFQAAYRTALLERAEGEASS